MSALVAKRRAAKVETALRQIEDSRVEGRRSLVPLLVVMDVLREEQVSTPSVEQLKSVWKNIDWLALTGSKGPRFSVAFSNSQRRDILERAHENHFKIGRSGIELLGELGLRPRLEPLGSLAPDLAADHSQREVHLDLGL